jgi:GDP-fucose transporter C1
MSASSLGIVLGVASSVTTAVHAIVVKRSLPIVNGQTLDLVYYSNLLSAGVIVPFILVSGELGVVTEMAMGGSDNPHALKTFLTGAAITVSLSHQ